MGLLANEYKQSVKSQAWYDLHKFKISASNMHRLLRGKSERTREKLAQELKQGFKKKKWLPRAMYNT